VARPSNGRRNRESENLVVLFGTRAAKVILTATAALNAIDADDDRRERERLRQVEQDIDRTTAALLTVEGQITRHVPTEDARALLEMVTALRGALYGEQPGWISSQRDSWIVPRSAGQPIRGDLLEGLVQLGTSPTGLDRVWTVRGDSRTAA
jgi:hypothetical protein